MSGNEDHHRQGRRFATEATGMMGVILAMSRLKDFVNGFVNLKSIRSIDTKDSMKTHQPTQLSKNMKTKDHVQNQQYWKGKHRVESWDKMKRLMEKKEFIAEFERVRMRYGVEENEEQTIACFLCSLRTDISDVVYLQQYYSFHDVCRLALKVEKQLSAKQKTTTCFSYSSRAPQSATGPVQVPTLIDEADPPYDTEDEVETEVVYLDRGELLVTRRLLNTAVLDQDDDTTWLRTNIFRTQCTAKGVPTIGCLWAVNDRRKPRNRGCPVVNGFVAQRVKDVFPEEITAGLPVIREIVRLHGVLRSVTSDRDAEFAYNRSNHSSTGRSPFFIMYGRNPFTPLDLAPMVGDGSVSVEGDERARQIKVLHAQLSILALRYDTFLKMVTRTLNLLMGCHLNLKFLRGPLHIQKRLYRDPKTGLPYATKEAFKIIRERHSSNNSGIKEKNSMGVLYDLTSQEDADVSLFISFVLPVMGMTFPRDGTEGLHSDVLIEEEFHDVEHWAYLLSCWFVHSD
nr:hypothetical protein [Tanacetum cinerariifolium]